MALTKEEKAANALAVTTLKQAQAAEILALKADLQAQGLTTSQINKAVSAEKKANSAELTAAKTASKTSGVTAVPKASTASTYTGQTAYNVANTLSTASGLYSQYGISPVTKASASDNYVGIPLDVMVKASLNQDASTGLFTTGSGLTKLSNTTVKTLNSAVSNYGTTVSAEEVGKLKSVGKDAAGNEIFTSKITSNGARTGYEVLKKNADGTYTNIGTSATTVPAQDSGGFFGSTLGKLAIGVGAALTGGALAPVVAGALGTSAAVGGAIAGGLTGAAASAITGGNALTGLVLGGAGGALSQAFKAASGLTDAEFAAFDYKNLASQGLSADQIGTVMSASGYSPELVSNLTQVAATTGTSSITDMANTVTEKIKTTYDTIAGGAQNLTDNQWLADQAKSLYSTSGGNLNAVAQNLEAMGVDPFVAADLAQQAGYGASSSQLATYLNQAYGSGAGLLSGANQLTQLGVQGMGTAVTGLDSVTTQNLVDAGLTTAETAGIGSLVAKGLSLNDAVKSITGKGLGDLIGGVASGVLGEKVARADKADRDAAAKAIQAAAAKSAGMMQFQPVGLTTRFGATTTPTYDETGRLTGVGYTAAEDIAAQRDRLLSLSNQALPTTTDTAKATKDYYDKLQALSNPQRELDLAKIRANLAATGRTGLATGATTGAGGANALAATNPELAAYYNALAQQQSQQALTAQERAQAQLNAQIATSGTLFGQAKDLEAAAQQPLTLGMGYGSNVTTANTNAGRTLYDAAVTAENMRLTGNLGVNTAQAGGMLSLSNLATGVANNLLTNPANNALTYNPTSGYGAGTAYSNMTPDEIANMQLYGV